MQPLQYLNAWRAFAGDEAHCSPTVDLIQLTDANCNKSKTCPVTFRWVRCTKLSAQDVDPLGLAVAGSSGMDPADAGGYTISEHEYKTTRLLPPQAALPHLCSKPKVSTVARCSPRFIIIYALRAVPVCAEYCSGTQDGIFTNQQCLSWNWNSSPVAALPYSSWH
jgi:hypothetical protein